MKAIGYIRVSTDEQASEGVSLGMQIAKIKTYCDLHDLTLVGIYGDPGISGKNMSARPGIQTVMGLVDAGKVDAVVVYKLDRLGRNTMDVLTAVERCEKVGASLHSITEQLDTRSAIGRFVVRTLASIAEMERDQVSDRTKAALAHKKANGERLGRPGFGTKVVNGELVTDSDAQATIDRVKEMRASGMTVRAIAAATGLDKTRVGKIAKAA